MKTSFKTSRALLLTILAPSVAQAHPGHQFSGLGAGFLHPLTGLDHLLAMLAVGLWAAQIGGKARWQVPGAFVLTMILGGALGVAGVSLPGVEQGIAASVFVLGLAMAFATRPPPVATIPLVALFALLHGHAHGTELAVGLSGWGYGAGFVAASLLLHAVGLTVGQLCGRLPDDRWLRLGGLAIATAGICLNSN